MKSHATRGTEGSRDIKRERYEISVRHEPQVYSELWLELLSGTGITTASACPPIGSPTWLCFDSPLSGEDTPPPGSLRVEDDEWKLRRCI